MKLEKAIQMLRESDIFQSHGLLTEVRRMIQEHPVWDRTVSHSLECQFKKFKDFGSRSDRIIDTIKLVRELTLLGLKDAKALVDKHSSKERVLDIDRIGKRLAEIQRQGLEEPVCSPAEFLESCYVKVRRIDFPSLVEELIRDYAVGKIQDPYY